MAGAMQGPVAPFAPGVEKTRVFRAGWKFAPFEPAAEAAGHVPYRGT